MRVPTYETSTVAPLVWFSEVCWWVQPLLPLLAFSPGEEWLTSIYLCQAQVFAQQADYSSIFQSFKYLWIRVPNQSPWLCQHLHQGFQSFHFWYFDIKTHQKGGKVWCGSLIFAISFKKFLLPRAKKTKAWVRISAPFIASSTFICGAGRHFDMTDFEVLRFDQSDATSPPSQSTSESGSAPVTPSLTPEPSPPSTPSPPPSPSAPEQPEEVGEEAQASSSSPQLRLLRRRAPEVWRPRPRGCSAAAWF